MASKDNDQAKRREAHYFTLREGLSTLRGFSDLRVGTRRYIDQLLARTAK